MKKNLLLMLSFILLLGSCQKSNVTTPTATTSIAEDELSSNSRNEEALATGKTRTELLCQHTWMYYRYYYGYASP